MFDTSLMFAPKARVLLVLPGSLLDRARVLAGQATAKLKLPVSLQIVLRALIEEGLKPDERPALLANVEGQARAVRLLREEGQSRKKDGETGRRPRP